MRVKEIMAKGARTYLAWACQMSVIDNHGMIEQLMRRAMSSRDAKEVNAIERYANAALADLYMNGRHVYEFTDEESAYINVTIELSPPKNKEWVDFTQEHLDTARNVLEMLDGALNWLCISDSRMERCINLTSALNYIRKIIEISRERALEAEFGPRAEREAALAAQMTAVFK